MLYKEGKKQIGAKWMHRTSSCIHVQSRAATFILNTNVIHYRSLDQIKTCFMYTHTHILPQTLIQHCNAQSTQSL